MGYPLLVGKIKNNRSRSGKFLQIITLYQRTMAV
jgi:hypothetical protein